MALAVESPFVQALLVCSSLAFCYHSFPVLLQVTTYYNHFRKQCIPSPSPSTTILQFLLVDSTQSGAVAGVSVDVSLYPIDTLKTRMQSAQGFRAAGGFRGVYAGLGSAAFGAAPGAALFFVTYDRLKAFLQRRRANLNQKTSRSWAEPLDHMLAASAGEVAACAVRVPTEVVKQRAQAGQHAGSWAALQAILSRRSSVGSAGVFRQLYRGWGITVMREVPFTVIQFPLWEALKKWWQRRRDQDTVSAVASATFGSISGAIAAAATTPLDVLKTRMMLSRQKESALSLGGKILKEGGARAFFAGALPRTLWISAGGFVFLGSYQLVHNALSV